jgi:hypothetical protein
MALYANYLYEHDGNPNEIRHWIEKAAEGGHMDSLSTYAVNMAETQNNLGYSINLVKAYGITYLLSKLGGGGPTPDYARAKLPEIEKKMSPGEIEKGLAFAKEWEKTHPAPSYFDPVYGY